MAKRKIPDNYRIVFLEYHTPEDTIVEADSTYLGYEVRRETLTLVKSYLPDDENAEIVQGYNPKGLGLKRNSK